MPAEPQRNQGHEPVQVLRPLMAARLMYVVLAVGYVAILGYVLSERIVSGVAFEIYAALSVAFAIWTAIRGYRLAVCLEGDSVRVMGLFVTRQISRSAIKSLGGTRDLPVLFWVGHDGRTHPAFLYALSTRSTAMPVFQQHAAEGRAALREWIDRG